MDDSHPKTGAKQFVIVFVALCLSIIQVALDEVVLGIAAPTITDEFNALDDIGWYGSSYLITSSSFQLVWGRLFTLLPVKATYLSALIIFEVGSIVCATAQSSPIFIAGRAFAGLGAGGLVSGTLTIISLSLPLHKVASFNAMVGAVNTMAFFSGPLISGAIVNHTTWRWIFYINPIIAAPTILFIILLLRLPDREMSSKMSTWKRGLAELDLPSTFLFAAGLFALLLPLQWGGVTYEWTDPRVLALFAVCAVLFTGFFVRHYLTGERGLVSTHITTSRTILCGMLFSFCQSGAGFTLEYYLPLWVQAVKDKTVLESGFLLLPVIGASIVFILTAGFLMPIVKYYVIFMYLAGISMTVGMVLLIMLDVNSTTVEILCYQIPIGVGMGLGIQQTVLAAQTVLGKDDIPVGVSLILLSQTLGGAISIGASRTIFAETLLTKLTATVPALAGIDIVKVGATSLEKMVPVDQLPQFIQAYSDSIRTTYFLPLALACASLFGAAGMEWRKIAPPQPRKNRESQMTMISLAEWDVIVNGLRQYELPLSRRPPGYNRHTM